MRESKNHKTVDVLSSSLFREKGSGNDDTCKKVASLSLSFSLARALPLLFSIENEMLFFQLHSSNSFTTKEIAFVLVLVYSDRLLYVRTCTPCTLINPRIHSTGHQLSLPTPLPMNFLVHHRKLSGTQSVIDELCSR